MDFIFYFEYAYLSYFDDDDEKIAKCCKQNHRNNNTNIKNIATEKTIDN